MKKWILAAAILGAASLQTVSASPVTMNFSSWIGASLDFSGGNFAFNDAGSDFLITSSSGGTNSAVGLFGNISGLFTIGAITINGTTQTAPVTGVGGLLSINDGASHTLTANLDWVTMQTNSSQSGINQMNTINLSNILYTGSNADLQTLAAPGVGIATVSFSFIPAHTLTELKAGSYSTGYSGVIASVPEPVTFSLMGVGLLGLGLLRKRLS